LLTRFYRCHAGDLYYAFGTILYRGLPFRDENDVLFSQQTVDMWSSFARTLDPNPDLGYLWARAYHETLKPLRSAPRWEPLSSAQNLTQRILDWPLKNAGFGEPKQCSLIGLGLDYYDK
jgi:carboxylesterase type B